MQVWVASVSEGGSGKRNQSRADLAEDVVGVVEHVLSEEPQHGQLEPFEMILTPYVLAAALSVRCQVQLSTSTMRRTFPKTTTGRAVNAPSTIST